METPRILGGMRVPQAMVETLKPFKDHSQDFARQYDGIGLPRVQFQLEPSEDTSDGKKFVQGLSAMEPFDIFKISDQGKTLVVNANDGSVIAIWGFNEAEIFNLLDRFQGVVKKCADRFLKPQARG